MIPQPLYAIILLFGGKAKVQYDATKAGDDAGSFFLHQTDALSDACGTIAMVRPDIINCSLFSLSSFFLLCCTDLLIILSLFIQ
jgi:hypothetical protein